MARKPNQPADKKGGHNLEFWLVVVMLIALVVLVFAVLFWPISPFSPQPTGREAAFKDILEYRTHILSVIVTAFGAWVGAGAAYFFGRENLRVAADSLLAMRDASPRERLRQTSIKQIPPEPIDWTVTRATKVDDVKKSLTDKPERWFVPVVRADGTLDTVIEEQGVWRSLVDPSLPGGATVEELVKHLDASETLKHFNQCHVVVTMDMTVGAANDLMDSKHVYLAIVTSEGKPTHFFTTSAIRKLVLQQ